MKKSILICALIALIGFITPSYGAEEDIHTSNKVNAEALKTFDVLNDTEINFKILQKSMLKNGTVFEEGSVLKAKPVELVSPKRGKRNGYLVIKPVSYTLPSKGTTENFVENFTVKVTDYKPFDAKHAALGAGVSAAGLLVKGASQAIYFGKGVLNPEEGENRLKSGAKEVYENSPLSYLSEGKEILIKQGEIFTLKFKTDDDPEIEDEQE